MASKILNGSLSGGFAYWTNPWLGLAYSLDAGRAKGLSSPTSTGGLTYKMKQDFSINEYVVGGQIWIRNEWNNPTGGVSNGSSTHSVTLVRPGGIRNNLAISGRGPGSGYEYQLNAYDITSLIQDQGNYSLEVELTVTSAASLAWSQISNDYGSWSNSGFSLYDSNTKVQVVSGQHDSPIGATISRSFTAAAPNGSITVWAQGIEEAPGDSIAEFWVELIKPDSSVITLAHGTSSGGGWFKACDNVNISSYLGQAGTYQIRLSGEVTSFWNGSEWKTAEIHFDDLDLDYANYSYTQAVAYFDDMFIEAQLRFFKTVKEKAGMDPRGPLKTLSKSESDITGANEAYSWEIHLAKAASNVVGIIERLVKKVFKTVADTSGSDDLGVTYPTDFASASDVTGSEESYSWIKRHQRASTGNVTGSREQLWARKVFGTIATIFNLSKSPASWTPSTPVSTGWRKFKVYRPE